MAKLPAANEFSPGQLGGGTSLFDLLACIQGNAGDRKNVVEWIRSRWFADSAEARSGDPADQLNQQRKRANNVVTGMQQYGLVDKPKDPLVLTRTGRDLLALKDSPTAGFEYFAIFLLRERHGLALLEAALAVRSRDGLVSKKSIAAELRSRGFEIPTNSTYPSKLRMWLSEAGLVGGDWVVDEAALQAIGVPVSSDIATWRALTIEQRQVVEALRIRSLGNPLPIKSHELLEILRQRGVVFDESQVGKQIYGPLIKADLIFQDVKAGGRGAKGGIITLTEFGKSLEATLIDGLELGTVPPELLNLLRRATADILTDLDSPDTGIKGIALELLALRMAADLGLMPADMRERSARTGGAEVDLVAEGAHLHFSRWLFQCKNQAIPVSLGVLAKEIGMATLLKAQVVVIVTTGMFAKSVIEYARQAAESTSVQIILLDGKSLANYRLKGSAGLRVELRALAQQVMVRKRGQLAEVPKE